MPSVYHQDATGRLTRRADAADYTPMCRLCKAFPVAGSITLEHEGRSLGTVGACFTCWRKANGMGEGPSAVMVRASDIRFDELMAKAQSIRQDGLMAASMERHRGSHETFRATLNGLQRRQGLKLMDVIANVRRLASDRGETL